MQANLTKKLKLIYFPILLTAVGYCSLNVLLNWLLFTKLHLFSGKEVYYTIIFSFGLTWVPIVFYLKRRINLLDIKGDDRAFKFMTSIYLFVAFLSVFSQNYFFKATAKLTQLENINQISLQPLTMYYSLKFYFIDTSHVGMTATFEETGKYSQYLDMNIYVTMPIFESQNETINSNCRAWLGKVYNEQISNKLNQQEKEQKYWSFYSKSLKKFMNTDFNKFVYLKEVDSQKDEDGFNQAVMKSSKFNGTNNLVFLSVNKPFAERTGKMLIWLISGFVFSALLWLFMTLVPKFDEEELKRFEIIGDMP